MTDTRCPCGSSKTYADCCQPYLTGRLNPQTPEQLMRSRYTAFGKGDIAYLIATQHPSKRQGNDRQMLAKTIAETEWLSLRILNHTDDYATKGVGVVEFVAFYRHKGALEQLHERSAFLRQNDRWYYLQGDLLPPLSLGRNDPCWCGSGRKYKQCHGI